MKHIYHYSAKLDNYYWDKSRDYDGLVELRKQLTSEDAYKHVKSLILNRHNTENNNGTSIVISSLTYLGSTE